MSLSHLRMSTETPLLREKEFIIGVSLRKLAVFMLASDL